MDILKVEMEMYDPETKVQLIEEYKPFILKKTDSLRVEGVYDSSFRLTDWGADMVVCATDPSVVLDNGEKLEDIELYANHRDFKLIR